MADKTQTRSPAKQRLKLVSIQEEGVERKLALAFGFMAFLPVLIIVWASFTNTDIMLAIFGIVGSTFIGYFLIVRRMIRAVMVLNRRVKEVTSGQASGTVDIKEASEIGELARSFNRITHELQQKIDELEASRQQVKRLLSRIGSAMMSYEGIDTLLNLIVENTVNALDAQMGSLMLVDGEKQELSIKTSWSTNGQVAEVTRVKLGEGIAGWVAKEGRPMCYTGKPSVLGFPEDDRHETEEGAILCVPLKLRDHLMGVVMVLRNDSSRKFIDDEQSLVANIGSQIAVAVENYRLNLDIERTYLETIMALALAVEAKDLYSAGHSKRVGFYAMKIGEAMGLDEETQKLLNSAGVLHDIGKIGIKDEILLKASRLTPEEEQIMQQHAAIGEAIVKPVRSLSKVGPLVLHHHEHFDGTGYPSGLKEDQIPLGARILAVADTYDSMITDRPYRKRLAVEVAKAELRECAGSHLDPTVVQAFLRVLEAREARRAASSSGG